MSHPIQYQVPLLRAIAAEPDIDLTVFFSSDFSTRGYYDRNFGCEVHWDVPLLEGYKYQILPRIPGTKNIHTAKPPSMGYIKAFTMGRFDVVWVHGYSTANSLHALMAARLIGADTLVRTDSTLLDRQRGPAKQALRGAFFRAIRPLVDCVLTCGTMNAQYWDLMLPGMPQVLMPYAVDNDYYSSRADKVDANRDARRAQYGISPGDIVFLYAAKLMPRKRCCDLLDAFHKISADKRVHLLIAGDGVERQPLEQQAREMFPDFGTPSARVRFLGFLGQNEIPEMLNLCDVFVLPSVHEPWALIVNEAMACRRPAIVSAEVGSAPDLVVEGVTGFQFDARDTNQLAECMQRFVAQPGLAAELGRNAFAHIQRWDFAADIRALRHALHLPQQSGQPKFRLSASRAHIAV